jgi:hypothetical protein
MFDQSNPMDMAKNKSDLLFFFKHYGKTKFMLMMSKKLQILGIEKLYTQSPKDFALFFILFLLRDTILYIVVPIFIVSCFTF